MLRTQLGGRDARSVECCPSVLAEAAAQGQDTHIYVKDVVGTLTRRYQAWQWSLSKTMNVH